MSGFVELHLTPAVAGVLESFGHAAEDTLVRDQVPTAARGHNLVLAAPPAARYAVPVLAGVVNALSANDSRGLVLVPADALAEWAAVLLPLADAAGLPALAVQAPGRATRSLREGRLRLLLTTPDTALTLLERSALKTDQLGHVILVWPEQFESDESLAALMQDVPAEAQRILIPAAFRPGHPLIERYARRALVCGPLAQPAEVQPEKKPARVATVSWSRRGPALASLLEMLDPGTLGVWCADRRSAAQARAALPVADATVTVTTGDVPSADVIVAWDLPTPARLAQLQAAGDVVLLAPAHAAPYAALITLRQHAIRPTGALEEARREAAQRRQQVQVELDRGDLDGELLALAALFDREDPTKVAAALYRLWRASGSLAATAGGGSPHPSSSAAPVVGRIWIGAGKKDGVTPADLVAALSRDVGMDASRIGKIEVREMFSLVEVPAAEAEEIARRLTGKTVRRREVTARLDRGGAGGRPEGRSGGKPVRRSGGPAGRR